MELSVRDVPVPSDGVATPLIAELADLDRQVMVEFFGNDDLTEDAEAQARHFADQTDTEKWWLAAHDADGRLVGGASVGLPRLDNPRLAEMEITVAPDADIAQVAPALWQVLEPRLAAAGRTSVHWWQMHRDGVDAPAESALVPGTGSGSVLRDTWTATLGSLGFVLEQVERHSVLDIAGHRDSWAALAAEAKRYATDYELLSWHGPTPDELLEPMARLRSRMSTDVPSGELDTEEEVWDAGRVARTDQRGIAKGRTSLYSVARHRDSGELVAYTLINSPNRKPATSWQEDTLVHAEHRGHRLGMLVKAANLDQLVRLRPRVERVHTWNADENQWMLAINVALGFAPASAEGAWQRRS